MTPWFPAWCVPPPRLTGASLLRGGFAEWDTVAADPAADPADGGELRFGKQPTAEAVPAGARR